MGWSHVATTTTAGSGAVASIAINVPAGTAAGDLMCAVIGFKPNASFVSTPSGWTPAPSASGQQALFRIATASEPASYTFSMATGTTIMVGAISTVRGEDPYAGGSLYNDFNNGSGAGTTPASFGGLDMTSIVGGLLFAYCVGRFTSGASVSWPSAGYTSLANLADSSGQVVVATELLTNVATGIQTPGSVTIPTTNQTAWGTGTYSFKRFRSNQSIA